MQKYVFIILVYTCFFLSSRVLFSQANTYQFEQIDSLQKVEKRNIVVFIHADWCKFCQAMIHTTFKNASTVKMLNERFYFVHLNAEERRDIVFNNHAFIYKPTGKDIGTNDLATQLGTIDGKLSFPTICVINPDFEIIFQQPDYINYTDLMTILDKIE